MTWNPFSRRVAPLPPTAAVEPRTKPSSTIPIVKSDANRVSVHSCWLRF